MTERPPDPTEDFDIDTGASGEQPPLPVGAVVGGKYTIQRLLGRGGTGTVYEAQHASIGHRVALKIVNSERAGRPETLARFQREARICGTIRHPNVGQIYDVGMTDDGKPYMVLELHEGQSLYDVLTESILPIPAIIEITLQILSALAAVHHAKIVHRDVKPDNAMLTRALNGDILVKLVDFGISKIVTADIRERTLTREGAIIGSPDYMAPEQLRGLPVDARTDLYATGVLMYEAVTGETPFDAESLSDLMASILRDAVRPPRELRPDCPRELEALIMKALSRDPEDRFQSAVDMARQLEQVRSVMRYTPDPGIAGLRTPMARRSERETRARRPRRKPKPGASAVTSTLVSETQRVRAKRPRRAPWLIGGALGLGVLTAIALSRVEREPAPPALQTPGVADAPARPRIPSERPPIEPEVAAEPVVTAEPEVAAEPAAVEPDAAVAHAPAPRSPRSRRERRPKPAVAEPAAEEPAPVQRAEPEEQSVKELLSEASSAFVLGQMPRARALYQEVIDRAPGQADAWRGIGLVASRMGQRNDAARAFQRYLALRPNAPDADRIREQLAKVQ